MVKIYLRLSLCAARFCFREAELISQLQEADKRSSEQARRREKAEREIAEFRETSGKLRESLEKAEKVSRGLRWELEDRRQLAAAEV